MKSFITSLLLLCCFVGGTKTYAQDIIILKNGEEILAKVNVVGNESVTYKKWDNLNGPDYNQPRSAIFMIKYANGTKDVFTASNSGNAETEVSVTQSSVTNIVTDTRDGKTYKTVTLGKQTWLAENLNYEMQGSWCIDCETYGRSYTYEAAKKACPTGWHLPSEAEWTNLTDFAGGGSVSGGNLKETGVSHWRSPNTGATNTSGFAALPHGFRTLLGYLSEPTKFALFWTSTEIMFPNIRSVRLDYNKSTVTLTESDRNIGSSIRCIKD
jgi:uncharacterized protein (TIGR02145 family)